MTTPAAEQGNMLEAESMIPRRRLLKAAALIGAGALIYSEYSNGLISRHLLEPDIDDIKTTLPDELKDKRINYTNEHYQPNFSAVIAAGVEAYKTKGGTPYYKKPPYYFTHTNLATTFGKTMLGFGPTNGTVDNGKSYQKLFNFSLVKPELVEHLYNYDPGSTAQSAAAVRLAAMGSAASKPATKEEFGPTVADVVIANAYSKTFEDTLEYIDALRDGRRVSTAEVYAYYLGQNKGDMVTSALDTTLFLKMASRIDVGLLKNLAAGTTQNIFKPGYAGAKLVSDRFIDEFSPSLPLDTLMETVSPTSRLNGFSVDTLPSSYKDYDPVNRAGTPYHMWNIFSLIASGEPSAAQEMVVGYYSSVENDLPTTEIQGKIKVETDMHAINHAKKIRAVFDQYTVD